MIGRATIRHRIPAAHGRSFDVKKGQFVAVLDVEGGQCTDFWALDAGDFDHYLAPSHTIIHIQSLQPKVGDTLVSNRKYPVLSVVADDVGRHDMLYPACDKRRYEVHFGVTDHRNCHDNFLEAMADRAWGSRPVPAPFNIFMNTSVQPDGTLITAEPLSKAGDKFIMRVEMDLVGVVSACPMDLTPTGGKGITDLEILVSDDLESLQRH
jgi:hypothetical protein